MDTIFETPRLRVRPWRESDAKALFRYAAEPEVGERAGWPSHESIEDSIKVIREVFSNGHTFAMELKETGEAIGCIGYYDHAESNIQIGEEDAEIGYWIGKPYWNQGLGTEALRGMVDWCFNKMGFYTLWSDYFVDKPRFRTDYGEMRLPGHRRGELAEPPLQGRREACQDYEAGR